MNVQNFTHLLQHPHEVVTASQTQELDEVLEAYPYFQAARAIQLKGLKNLHSFKYNKALKITAAHTTDRDILFEFITSKDFLQHSIADTISGKTSPSAATQIIAEEIIPPSNEEKERIETSNEAPLPQNPAVAGAIPDPNLSTSKDSKFDPTIEAEKQEATKSLELGKPLAFTKDEKNSFGEWLNLTSQKAVTRSAPEAAKSDITDVQFQLAGAVLKKRKFELIDRFIVNKPKIIPSHKTESKISKEASVKLDKKELMTETLAKVYLEQKKYKKAIQAYTILSLKYPEKSGFFADRIRAVQKLQQENS